MKRSHRFFTSAIALSLLTGIPAASSVVMPVMAADPTETTESTETPKEPEIVKKSSITINNADEDVTYLAYPIFTGTLVDDVLVDIEWAEGVNDATIIQALKATDEGKEDKDKLFTTLVYETKEVDGEQKITKSTAKDVAGLLNDTTSKIFLDNVAQYVVIDANKVSLPVNKETKTAATENNISAGYYLITEKRTENAEAAKLILTVVGPAEVNPKTSGPISEKHVHENTVKTGQTVNNNMVNVKGDLGYQDVADYAIGEKIDFILTVDKIPSSASLKDWKKYELLLHDKASEGVDIDTSSIKVYAATKGDDGLDLGPELTTGFTKTAPGTDGDAFQIAVTLKEEGKTAVNTFDGKVLVVTFKGSLNNKAAVNIPASDAVANTNKFKLDYTADAKGTPKEDGPWDETIIYTYQINAVKKDATDPNNKTPLGGATFKLFKLNGTKGNYTKVYMNTDMTFGAGEGKTEWSMTTASEGDTKGKIEIKGLDEGEYYLEETNAPAGYNSLANYIRITVTSTKKEVKPDKYTSNGQTPAYYNELSLTTVEVDKTNYEVVNGTASDFTATKDADGFDVDNKKGTQLPTTGGMGTTLFYTVGGLMVAGAAIFMVTSKRMKKEEE